MEAGADSFGEAGDGGCFRQAGNAFDQQMAVAEEADHHAMDERFLADDRVADFGDQLAKWLALDFYFLRELFEIGVSYGGR